MTSEIAVRAEIVRADAYEPRSTDEAWGLAETLYRSKLLPRGLACPEAVLYSLIAGRELGLTATQSLRSLHIVEGKVVLAADLIVAMIKRNKNVCKYFRLVESTAQLACYETLRVDEPEPTKMTWTFEQATKAGLTGKDNWRKYPDAMLRARCSAYLARAVYPDLAMGMYDPDEADEFEGRGRSRARVVAEQPANTQTDHVAHEEHEADATEVTPLDHLREALKSTKTVETIRAAWVKHSNAISEQGTSALKTARDEVFALHNSLGFAKTRKESDALLGKGEAPKAPAAPPAANDEAPRDWRVDDLSEDEGDHDTTRALKSALCDAPDGAAVVARWREASPEVKTLPERDAKACYDAVVARWAQLMGTLDAAAADRAFREALKSPPDDSPKGTRKAAPKPAADAQGSASEAAAGTGTQARAALPESAPYVADAGAWEARCIAYRNSIEARRSWERHCVAFRAAGLAIFEARRIVAAQRMQALTGISEESIAVRVLDDAERAADKAALIAAEAKRTGRSETTVRRIERNTNERGMRLAS